MASDKDKDRIAAEAREQSSITFSLDLRSGVPTYLQIVQQVESSLRLGRLQSGDRLPKVKDVVATLAINPNTVLKAYRELENRGITIGRPGVGTFIIAPPLAVSANTFLELRSLLITGWLQHARDMGLGFEEIAALFQSALNEAEARAREVPELTRAESVRDT
ncbi:MAG: GntR family transcriptional regulator [Acidimicrobiales bacterium]